MSSSLAVVTGSSSGIGAAITKALLANGWQVVGISRRKADIADDNYHQIQCDLTDTKALGAAISDILTSYGKPALVVNNAGVGHFAPHEELSVNQIEELVKLNLLAPLLVARGFLRALKETRGNIIAISSFSALESSSFGATYAATKAGLEHFNRSLFDEVRKSGVKVTTITPDITRTPFYDQLSFYPQEGAEFAIAPECIAEAVINILKQPEGTVTTQVVLRPARLNLGKRGKGLRSEDGFNI
jgi:short-subunit dehydrogenase